MQNSDTEIGSFVEPSIFPFDDAESRGEFSVDAPALLDIFDETNDRSYYAFGGGGGGPSVGTTTCCASGTCDIYG